MRFERKVLRAPEGRASSAPVRAAPLSETPFSASLAKVGYTLNRVLSQPDNVFVATNSTGKEVMVRVLDPESSAVIRDDVTARLAKTSRAIASVISVPVVEISDVQRLDNGNVAVFVSPIEVEKLSDIRSTEVTEGKLVSLAIESAKHLSLTERFIGAQISKFTVEALIGIGGMAIIFKGRDPEIGQEVAIKILMNSGGSVAEGEERIKREASILTKLRHPNILRVVLFTRLDSGDIALITDLESGKNLSERLSEGPLTMSHAQDIFAQVFDALIYAHSYNGTDNAGNPINGVLHRDIKPSNILVDDSNGAKLGVKLIDFGIARSSAAVALTRTGVVVGSERYMAPELSFGRQASPASEVYSLAVTIVESLSGQTINDVLEGGTASPNFLRKNGISKGYIDAVLMKALNFDASQRYQDMRSFKDAFNEAMKKELGEAEAPVAQAPVPRAVTPARPVSIPRSPRPTRPNVIFRATNRVVNAVKSTVRIAIFAGILFAGNRFATHMGWWDGNRIEANVKAVVTRVYNAATATFHEVKHETAPYVDQATTKARGVIKDHTKKKGRK